jgi:hypothetical protein
MHNSNTQTQGLFSAIAKSDATKSDLREPKNLLASDIKLKPKSLVFNLQIISAELIENQNPNDLIAQAKPTPEVKDFHLGLILMMNTLSSATQLLDPEEDGDDEDDEDFDEDDDDDDEEDEEEEIVKVALNLDKK